MSTCDTESTRKPTLISCQENKLIAHLSKSQLLNQQQPTLLSCLR